jgi:hypothetical protein
MNIPQEGYLLRIFVGESDRLFNLSHFFRDPNFPNRLPRTRNHFFNSAPPTNQNLMRLVFPTRERKG